MKEGWSKILLSKSKTFAVFCLCFLAGVALASGFVDGKSFVGGNGFFVDGKSFVGGNGFFVDGKSFVHGINLEIILVWVILSLLFICVIVWTTPVKRLIISCLLVFTLGFWRYFIAWPANDGERIHALNGQRKTIEGYIVAEPDARIHDVRYILEVEKTAGASKQNARGRVYFKTDLYPRYFYGDRLEISCALRWPEPIEDNETGKTFAYDKYLARYGVFSVCQFPKINKIGQGSGNRLRVILLRFKSKISDNVSSLWHEPHASFMAGLLYGYRGGLGNLQELFSITGVTHIVAISGYNITIIATILISVCVNLCIPRQKAFWFVIAGIILFVVFTGASASVVRAGIMGIITLLARQLGRPSRIGNVLLLAAVLMNLHNPFVLVYDAGFQLSFLSTLGLVYLSPIFQKKISWMPEALSLRESFISTLSAITATLPLILYQFGRLSLVAPIVNVLILWLIPWLMLIGAIALALSFVWWPLGQIVAYVAWIGLEYIIRLVKWFADLPLAAVRVRLPALAMITAYFGIIYLIYYSQRKKTLYAEKMSLS